MIAVARCNYIHPDHAEAFEGRFRNRARLVDEMSGFVSNRVLRPTAEGDPYVVLMLGDSREDYDAWVESDAFRKGHAKSGSLPEEAFVRESKLEIHEVFLGSNNKKEVA